MLTIGCTEDAWAASLTILQTSLRWPATRAAGLKGSWIMVDVDEEKGRTVCGRRDSDSRAAKCAPDMLEVTRLIAGCMVWGESLLKKLEVKLPNSEVAAITSLPIFRRSIHSLNMQST
jgi:hypothetical protein